MPFPKYRPGPVEYWLAAAATEFVNGFIAGLGTGSFAGVGAGATTGLTSAGDGLTAGKQLLLSAIAFLAAAAGNGLKRFIVWHNQNPFPNPWPAPTSEVDKKPAV